ncbi:MAG TPA: class I SAM-dependent methyltransferase, partial [Ilumatobacteraceae bacterium]
LAGRIMSQRSSNRERSAWTVDLLDVQPDDRILELGYGPGLGLEAALVRLSTGRLVGLDHSTTMRNMAARRLRAVRSPVQPDLRVGSAEALPDDLGTFDKVFSCNVWLFWKDPVTVLGQLRGHLAPGATVAVTHLPRHGGATRETTIRAAHTISAQFVEAGYSALRHELLELDPAPAVCVLATSPRG